jgi:hypothetical protein
MKSRIVWCLVWINVALLVGWALRVTSPTAQAQAFQRPPNVLLIPGQVNGGSVGVIYVLDATGGRLSAVSYDDSSNRISAMPMLDLNQVFQTASGRR